MARHELVEGLEAASQGFLDESEVNALAERVGATCVACWRLGYGSPVSHSLVHEPFAMQ